ncbi:MarR family transcriptional regulator [Klebsiella pneumoniae subsp. pneumoniae]|nr:MarR family transcriptional regulator [Klebsiella pneumoniae subsp. pneumoniae]
MRGDDGRAAGHVAGTGKSSVSRMVSRLLEAGELEERPCAEDARAKSLAPMTAKGHDTVAKN